jgi:hypothetical protein
VESRLNGVPFRDARLQLGDRLSFGPIEFVIEAPTAEFPAPAGASKKDEDPLTTHCEQSRLDQDRLRLEVDSLQQERAAWTAENARMRSEFDAERRQLDAEREAAARRMQDAERQENQHRAVMNAQLSQLEREQQEWAIRRRAEEQRLLQESAQLEAAVARLKQEQQALIAQTAAAARPADEQAAPLPEAQERLAREQASLEELRREQATQLALRTEDLAAREQMERAALALTRHAWEADFHQAERTWAQQSVELDARTVALERRIAQFESERQQDADARARLSAEKLQAARAELEAERRDWQQTQAGEAKRARGEQDLIGRQLEHLRAHLTAEQAEIVAERARLETLRRELETRAPAAQANEAATPAKDYGFVPEHDQDHECSAEQIPARARSGEHASHQESIEAYMTALFGRIRDRESGPVIGAAASGGLLCRKDARGEQTALSLSAQAREGVPAIELPSGPIEMIRRASIEMSNLGAMRELANTHTTLVLGTHRNKQLLRRVVFVWSAALVCVCLTILVLSIAPPDDAVSRTGVMVVAIAGIYWTFVGPLATQRWIATRRRERKRVRAMADNSVNEPSTALAGQKSGSSPS